MGQPGRRPCSLQLRGEGKGVHRWVQGWLCGVVWEARQWWWRTVPTCESPAGGHEGTRMLLRWVGVRGASIMGVRRGEEEAV